MTKNRVLTAILVLSWLFALANDSSAVPETDGSPQRAPASSAPSEADDEPEEPDFAFLAGGPYTQKKNSIQFIFPSQWGRRSSGLGGSILQHAEFGTLLRTEWGLTDRWELDVIMSAEGERDHLGSRTINSTFSLSDSVVGARYRLLRECSAPFTLAMGPQVIIPTGSLLQGSGFDTPGFAWDVATAKDWRGPVFLYTSLNYAIFPSVNDPVRGSRRHFNLQNVFYAAALGLRPVEKDRGTSHHDLHAFLEYGVGREDGLEAGPTETNKVSDVVMVFAPGIRYGFLTRSKKLFEVGISIPLGLNSNTPRGGVIVQFQFENVFRRGGEGVRAAANRGLRARRKDAG